jgi:hypothetical protein
MAQGIPRCEVVPLPGRQASFRVDGVERTCWHFGDDYPRPYFYPLIGPESGEPLTRMGHPGAPDHDHHQSVWFAHHKVLGIDFWGNAGAARIRQQRWLVYEDGDDAAGMAVQLGWFDGHDAQPLLEQELVAFLRPLDDGEYTLDLQSAFRPRSAELEFQQTNFGFLAVRVAKRLSAHFGGGQLTSSSGAVGETEIFGKPAKWVDYSGPMPKRGNKDRDTVFEGITYFDHPANPGYPNSWHVREDGWLGCSPCLRGALTTTQEHPLVLRYVLHVHRGKIDAARADELAESLAVLPAYRVIKSMQQHRQFEIERV